MNSSLKNDSILLYFFSIYGRYPNFKEVLYYKRYFNQKEARFMFGEMVQKYEQQENTLLSLTDQDLENHFQDISSRGEITKNVYMTLTNFEDLAEDCHINNIKKEWDNAIHCNVYRYNDEECRSLIEEHFDASILSAYDKLIPGAFKSDIWRLCVLHLHGGVYADVHIKPELKSTPNVILDSADYIFCIDYPSSPDYIYNALMKFPKGSQLALDILHRIAENVANEIYPKSDLEISGPGLHGSVIKEVLGIEQFQEGFLEHNNEIYLFLKHTKHNKPKSNFEYSITFQRNLLFLCRYKDYRNDISNICKLEHYSTLFKKKMVYRTNTDSETNE